MTEGKGEVRELPQGWCWTKLGEICQEVENKKPELEPDLEFQYIDIASIDNAIKKVVAPKKYLGKNAPSRARQVVKTDDIVFSTVRTYLMNIALVPKNLNNQIASTDFCVIRGIGKINQKYIFYYALSNQFITPLNELQRGTSYPAVRDRDIFYQSIPFCSTTEQNRIVEKLEELFSDLDNGIENLKTAQKQLKVYRQAVLKWAFEGKLTEEWRKQNNDLPTAKNLLAQIKAERENRYQQQLAEWGQAVKDWEANVQSGKKPTKPQKLKDLPLLTEIELSKLPVLPNMWGWVRFGELIAESIQNGLYKPASQYGNGILIIRIDNFHDGVLNHWRSFKRLSLSLNELNTYKLDKNEILINRVNSMTHIGKCALVEKIPEDCVFESNIMRLKTASCSINPKFITLFLSSTIGLKELRKNAKQAVNQASINQNDVQFSSTPICSIEEQIQIVQEIESRLSTCDRLEETITTNLKKAEALRQSILKQAFEGKLVPQDPNDEPAEKLLERIKQEKLKLKNGMQLSLDDIREEP